MNNTALFATSAESNKKEGKKREKKDTQSVRLMQGHNFAVNFARCINQMNYFLKNNHLEPVVGWLPLIFKN